MKIKPIAPNQTVLSLDNGTEVLFSYSTPVAAFIPGRGYVRTEKYHSVTTSRHINKWLDGAKTEEIPQSELDKIGA